MECQRWKALYPLDSPPLLLIQSSRPLILDSDVLQGSSLGTSFPILMMSMRILRCSLADGVGV